jgi:hypothetical protein
MARRFLSCDPVSGLLVTTASEGGKAFIGYEQDVSKALDFAKAIRNERTKDNAEFTHVAFIPDVVILKMKFEDGVNFYDKSQRKEVLRLLQTKYTACKTTDKKIA